MIEFTADGPFSGSKADPLVSRSRARYRTRPNRGGRLRPAGSSWTSRTGHLALRFRPADDRGLRRAEPPFARPRPLVHGLGCSGDLDLAREIVLQEAGQARGLDARLRLRHSRRCARQLDRPRPRRTPDPARPAFAAAKIIAIGVQPFCLRGRGPSGSASISAVAALRAECDSVLVAFPRPAGDQSLHPAQRPAHGFHLMHQLMAQAVQALCPDRLQAGADPAFVCGCAQPLRPLSRAPRPSKIAGSPMWMVTSTIQHGRPDRPALRQSAHFWPTIPSGNWSITPSWPSAARATSASPMFRKWSSAFKERVKTDVAIATSASPRRRTARPCPHDGAPRHDRTRAGRCRTRSRRSIPIKTSEVRAARARRHGPASQRHWARKVKPSSPKPQPPIRRLKSPTPK